MTTSPNSAPVAPKPNVEQVGGSDVGVAVGVAGVDRGEGDGGGDGGGVDRRPDDELGVDVAEAAPDLGHAEVADGEAHMGVGRVERPTAGGERQTVGYDRLARPLGILDRDPPNLVAFTFGDERARTAYPDWAAIADEQVGNLSVACRPATPRPRS